MQGLVNDELTKLRIEQNRNGENSGQESNGQDRMIAWMDMQTAFNKQ